jgi:hypothetical protein
MIMMIIAAALIQCSTRTQTGWIVFAVAGAACVVLIGTVDMASSGSVPLATLRAGAAIVTAPGLDSEHIATRRNHKKASRVSPARYDPPRYAICGRAGDQAFGIKTVSTT